MGNEKKEPDFYPFRLKDHGWVLKKAVPIEKIGEAFRELVYQLVTKDFSAGSVAEKMYNDAVGMMQVKSDKARKAAEARWGQDKIPPTPSTQSRCPRSKEEFEQFIYEPSNNINTALAWEWFDIHKARGWTDKDGKPLKNWKGAMMQYCKVKENKNV